ncbi:MAG: Hsp20 family protein [Gammaproteobacteria bacterium]|nr:Hsp20 family protein [Gammaproteobacteria bacterium]
MSKHEISVFNPGFDLFDPFFGDDFFRREVKKDNNFLKTDVIENEKDYELIMDVPGLEKEDVNIEVEDGYLTVTASKKYNEEDKKKNFVRKERRFYESKRSFYVGNIDDSLVSAKLEKGELHIVVPKEKEQVTNKKTICIE